MHPSELPSDESSAVIGAARLGCLFKPNFGRSHSLRPNQRRQWALSNGSSRSWCAGRDNEGRGLCRLADVRIEYDPITPENISYNVYRDGAKIASVADSTNYLDPTGTSGAAYSVRAVIGGVEQEDSGNSKVWAQNYLRIPLTPPPPGVTPGLPTCETPNEGYTYDANDGSVGDLNGDHDYEIVLKWLPQNQKDNSQSGCTGNVYVDAYQLDGTLMWRIDLGVNIRAGAHYTQFLVYDFDGDGKAEVVMKTAPGTKDGTGAYLHLGPAAEDDQHADYRTSDNPPGWTGLILTGPEYLTVFDGTTGAELATVNFDVPRGDVSTWGDSIGNRSEIYLASAGFVSDLGEGKTASGRPSILMARGVAARTAITAWNWRDGQLTEIWKADSDDSSGLWADLAGQGADSMAVADVDADGAQELVYGSATIDSDGTLRCTTGFGHGRSLHVGDLVPTRPGLEVFMPHDVNPNPVPTFDVHDASTCEIISSGQVQLDPNTARGVSDDVSPNWPGAEAWTNNTGGVVSATTGMVVDSALVPPTNFSHPLGCRRLARVGRWNRDYEIRRHPITKLFAVRLEQQHQGHAGLDCRSIRRLARRNHLARDGQYGFADLHNDGRDDTAPIYAHARPTVPHAGVVGTNWIQPAAPHQLPHWRLHGGSAEAEHQPELGRTLSRLAARRTRRRRRWSEAQTWSSRLSGACVPWWRGVGSFPRWPDGW